MSNLLLDRDVANCPSKSAVPPTLESTPARTESLGQLTIRRSLPIARRRTVGPWCFFDRYGPLTFSEGKPMDVAPHPHIGLQTVSWLTEGEVLHRDSLGCEQLVRAGGLNLMTSGRGIAHSEETPRQSSGHLSGVQLWIALPEQARASEPRFDHYAELPRLERPGGVVHLFAGEMDGVSSPARVYSPLLGAQVRVAAGEELTVPLEPDFEHALVFLEGEGSVDSEMLAPDALHFLGCGRSELSIAARSAATAILIGGLPLGDPIVMWWNFVARSHQEIAAAREAWERGERFGEVAGYRGPRLAAPPLRARAKPNPAS
jgi:quercetin 2,3-dioxygenase